MAWVLFLCSSALVLAACRKGSDTAVASFIPVVPSLAGTQGCAPTTPVPGTLVPVFNDAVIGPSSQIAAVAGTETLYLTGADGSIHELVFPVGGGPLTSDIVRLAAGVIETTYLVPAGISAPAELSGITIFDDQFLIVAEHASNTLLAVRRDIFDSVQSVAGLPLAQGGFADGLAGSIRFHFSAPAALFAAANGSVYVCDTENHALRQVVLGVLPQAVTIAGNGAPGAGDGALTDTQLDTPSGIAASCPGELLLVEAGTPGFGGHRLLSLAIGAPAFFGGFEGNALVLAGDGTDATVQGIDDAAQLGTPTGLAATQDGLVFWVDATAGILRRYDFSTGLSDCPLFADCAAAVTAGGSFAGAHFSLAIGASGALYVLEADSGVLHRVDP